MAHAPLPTQSSTSLPWMAMIDRPNFKFSRRGYEPEEVDAFLESQNRTLQAAKKDASSTVSRRGEAISTYAVPGAVSSSTTRWERSRKPCSIPSKAWKKAMASRSTSPPTTRAMVRRKAWVARLMAFR